MEIRWFGHSFFELKTDTNIKKEVKIYFDPFHNSIGIDPPKNLVADVVLLSHNHDDHNNLDVFEEKGIVLTTAGEYSIKGVDVKGTLSFHDKVEGKERGANIIFSVSSENLKIAHLGDLGHPLDERQIKELGKVDVLLVPIGSSYSMSLKEMLKTIKEISPKIIIPMHYKTEGENVEVQGIEPFYTEMGISEGEPLRKLVLKSSNLEGKEMEVVVLERN